MTELLVADSDRDMFSVIKAVAAVFRVPVSIKDCTGTLNELWAMVFVTIALLD